MKTLHAKGNRHFRLQSEILLRTIRVHHWVVHSWIFRSSVRCLLSPHGFHWSRIRLLSWNLLSLLDSGAALQSVSPLLVLRKPLETEEFGARSGTTYFLVSIGTLIAIPIARELLKVADLHGP